MKDYIASLEQMTHTKLVLMLARQRLAATEPIAVVGMGLRFPGRLESPVALWEALHEGRIVYGGRDLPTDSKGRMRWNDAAADVAPYAELLRRGSYVDDIDLFDAERFAIGEEEATFMDPQQRLLVTCAAEAMADAGLTPGSGVRTAVFAAVSTVEYNYAALRNGITAEQLSGHMGTGGALSAAAGRVATALRLNGPALTVDTACSSALVALHLACAALRADTCDVAVVGAGHLVLAPGTFGIFARTGMLSPTGRCRPFDALSDGYVRGEGCGVLVLQRQRDVGDRPAAYATIRGTAIHQQGDRASISAVSAPGQSRVIDDALRAAEVEPEAVRYVEAQANGAKLAAVIEAEVMGRSYRGAGRSEPLLVGSAKANLGYLETASGMASLMKTLLVVQHGEIPPQVALEQRDPAVAWERLGLDIPRTLTGLPGDGAHRLAGVSSFGFTGTYAHAVVGGATRPRPPGVATPVPAGGASYWPESHLWS